MSSTGDGESERALLQRVVNGQAGAWNDLVDRFIGLVYHTLDHTAQAQAVRLTSREMEGLCAEVFGTLLGNHLSAMRDFGWTSNFETWLTVHARRHVLGRIQERLMAGRLEQPVHEPAEIEGDAVDQPEPPEPAPGATDQGETTPEPPEPEPSRPIDDLSDVGRRMDGLPWLEAQVVRLHHLEHKSDEEIAALLGIAEDRVPEILRRADARVKDEDPAESQDDEP